MPIYEFYCPNCHTIYNFFSRSVNTDTRPACPGCKRDSLQRRVSRFAVVSAGKSEGEKSEFDLPIDEAKMENAVASLASEAEGMNEEDPRAAARLMQRFSQMTGLKLGKNMEEALRRLESGEDPEAIEAEMGDLLEGDESPFEIPDKKAGRRSAFPPARDETLYEM
ncbi:MAG TPA: zinc ribbon domain-containing protein [Terriglobia bacterium]|nr:zinc ribbon domain-containing protein [Terriglobia bacterium]